MNILDNMVVPDASFTPKPMQRLSIAPLPPLSSLPSLSPSLPLSLPKAAPMQAMAVAPANGEKFLFVCSRDLDQDEMDLLSSYGKILTYDDCMLNIPLDVLVSQDNISYILFDVRKKSHRMTISKEASNDGFHVVAIINKWESQDDFVEDANCENCISKLPPKQAFKRDFDRLLLEKKIRKPSCLKSCMRVCSKGFSK
jgi:hypothetical protein